MDKELYNGLLYWGVAGAALSVVPILIAMARHHARASGVFALSAAMVLNFAGGSLPTASVKPTRWKVSGVDRQTQLDCSEVIAAESPANAKVKAELRGMVVTSIDPA